MKLIIGNEDSEKTLRIWLKKEGEYVVLFSRVGGEEAGLIEARIFPDGTMKFPRNGNLKIDK